MAPTECHDMSDCAEKRPRVRAAVAVLHEGRVLLVEHTKDDRRYWLLPGGGLDWGESWPILVALVSVLCGDETRLERVQSRGPGGRRLRAPLDGLNRTPRPATSHAHRPPLAEGIFGNPTLACSRVV